MYLKYGYNILRGDFSILMLLAGTVTLFILGLLDYVTFSESMLGLISIALVVVVSILVSIDRKLKIMLDKK